MNARQSVVEFGRRGGRAHVRRETGGTDWPVSIPGLGDRIFGHPFALCADCAPDVHPAISGTFANYGGARLCRTHAQARARLLEGVL